jgi:hypothetical protein
MACASRDRSHEAVALEEASFLLLEKPRFPLINKVEDNIFATVNHPSTCHAAWNLFGDGTSAHVYKPLHPDDWPKSKNGKKICHLDTFKLSILQENKWEVGQTFEATLLTPSNIPPLVYGGIYCLLLGTLEKL